MIALGRVLNRVLNLLPDWAKRRLMTGWYRFQRRDLALQRGAGNYDWLFQNIVTSRFPGELPLIEQLAENRSELAIMLARNPVGCRIIERFWYETECAKASGLVDDMFMFQSRASLYTQLAQVCERTGLLPKFQSGFEAAISYSEQKFLDGVDTQIKTLSGFLVKVSEAIRNRLPPGARVFLLELPTGNSLLIQCLERLLKPHLDVETIWISLPRNTKASAGLTRRDLIAEKLRASSMKANDILVHIDEWISGANFRDVGNDIRKLTPPGVTLLPLAILAPCASAKPKYSSSLQNHDRWVRSIKDWLKDFRVTLPPMATSVAFRRGDLFWSERDRLTGYRKVQPHAVMFDMLDRTIEELHADEEAFELAVPVVLDFLAEKADLPGHPARSVQALRNIFEEGYSDYHLCREELRESWKKMPRGDEFPNVESALSAVIERYYPIMRGRPALKALQMVASFNDAYGSLDPSDDHWIDGIVPTIAVLEGIAALPHEAVLERIMARCRSLLSR